MTLARLGFGLLPVLGLLPLIGAGCSDPVPPTPRGAWSVSFISPNANCPVSGHNAKVGDVTDHTKERVIVDGEDNVSVDCTVSGSGSFNVSANAIDNANGLAFTMAVEGISPSATLDKPATGGVSFSSPTTGGEPAQSNSMDPCIFYFIPDSGEGIDAGKIWVAFQCPSMQLDMGTCAIQQGYAIFENCET